MRALPESFRTSALAASEAVVVDRERWGRMPPPPPELRDRLRDAIVARRRIRFGYRDGEVAAEPWGLVDKTGLWYLLADPGGGVRAYRVDRMSRLDARGRRPSHPRTVSTSTPSGTASAPASSSAATRSSPSCGCRSRLAGPLRDVLGARHVRELGVEPDGPTAPRSGSNTVEMLARQLAGWEPEAEVEGPPEVRAALATLGRSLAARYAD